MELGELFVRLGPMLVSLAPHMKKIALYMFHRRERTGEYDERFRELLAFARDDVRQMSDGLEEIEALCRRFNIDTEEPGSISRIDARLDWYLSLRQRRILRKIEHLSKDIQGSSAGIADVIACLGGITAEEFEGVTPEYSIGTTDYAESEPVASLTYTEQRFRYMLADREVSIAHFLGHAREYLDACDKVLAEFTQGISVSSSSN